ncbi:MAG: two pore domain potassium channel family protein [Polyangiaceae bacterium]|nr:two pore domain potassium channel family protein [Polyangiaceae bacterium]
MARDLDKAAIHAMFDLLLRNLANAPSRDAYTSRKGAYASPSAGQSSQPGEPAPDALIAAFQNAKSTLRDFGTRDPMDAVATIVGAGTVLFYAAEKGKNPKVQSMWDALAFITTCLSVGYDQVFAKTPAGKAIASFVMTVGPSLAARAFDPPRAETERDAANQVAAQQAVVERLDAILRTLQAQHAAS